MITPIGTHDAFVKIRGIDLSPVQEADASNLVRLYTDPKVRVYLGGPIDLGVAVQRAQVEVSIERELPLWVIRTRLGEQFAGVISFDTHHDGIDVEVSFELLPEHCGKGYATEALTLALHYARSVLALKRVIAETQSKNDASIRLLNRVGMTLESEVMRFGQAQCIYVTTW
ncbi:GNAT family N-acetyltransferase [Pseudomonas chlororaphis]|uniref:GNAT family N-acetyltransferase n=1 Tax=Pseudomonas chlororaphis TaxID=587753 RepID=UPI0019258483|nr:GNAT family N-acetyltransferase [Pseudomonas chlororaphis]QQX57564.1 GNAT family N-acetyltransferase [Pseudomonas chlororaphis subsp. aurantiaca]